jgi:DNA helicase II / ATP-dependent DNA helicase PcrA
MSSIATADESAIDAAVDDQIYACLNLRKPRSFFLYAGAGSGKTRSLVKAIHRLREENGRQLSLRGQRMGVITYTNAACDEIKQRLEFDPLVEVSTIHSFAWSLIDGYDGDIRAWLRVNLFKEIEDLHQALAKGRASKASRDRARSIESKQNRLAVIEKVKRFVYSPIGDNRAREALNHSEVINITSDFLKAKPTLQSVLVNRYPVLLIDESQDTNRHLMDALLTVQSQHRGQFCLGLFGDTMQRIYSDGKADLAAALPGDWARPVKQMNYRCPGRIIRLINRIRANVDGQKQRGRSDRPDGFVRLFVLRNQIDDKFGVEAKIGQRMAEITGDTRWAAEPKGYKSLILEHHMAAKRMGFDAMFDPLFRIDRFRTGLMDGTLPSIRFFSNDVLPVVRALERGDQFAVASIVRNRSPLLEKAALRVAEENQLGRLKKAKLAADDLMKLWRDDASPSFIEVLRNVAASGLFAVPQELYAFVERKDTEIAVDPLDSEDEEKGEIAAWDLMLRTPFEQITAYDQYVNGRSPFETHQGVKGLEFPRVMVIISDEEARGFLFSYEKLFGAKEKSRADQKNEGEGSETSIDRTRRLFYVTCSRAESSLAIVAYSEHPQAVQTRVIEEGWFDESEVELA